MPRWEVAVSIGWAMRVADPFGVLEGDIAFPGVATQRLRLR
jgi:hypothetical protein